MKKILLFLIMLTLYGCDQSAQSPGAAVSEAPVSAGYSQTGTVLETIDVDAYTYILLDVEGSEVWIASSPVWVAKGDVVSFSDAMLMKDFHSKTLDRTFADILFVGNLELISGSGADNSAAQAPSPHAANPHAANPHENVTAGAAPAPGSAEPVAVEPLEGGTTIAALFAEGGQLEGREVSLRARVVKFSPNILGKNWVTLQDGTGAAPDDKLVVTTSQEVEIGAELIVKGTVKTNVDLGAGYAYKLVLEGAVLNP